MQAPDGLVAKRSVRTFTQAWAAGKFERGGLYRQWLTVPMGEHLGKTDRSQEHAARRPRPFLLGTLALVVVIGGALLAAKLLWPDRDKPTRSKRPAPATDSAPVPAAKTAAFSGAAFSPQATADDLKAEAIRTAEELLRAYPDGTDSMRIAARLQSSLGNSEAAAAIWQRCVELDPHCAEAYFKLGEIANSGGNVQQAATLFGKAAALVPDDPLAPALQADALIKLGRAEEAVAVLEPRARAPAMLDKAMLILGQAYLQLSQLDKAKQTFETLIRADPDEARAYYGLARVYARLGRKDESQENLEKFKSLASVDQEDLRLGTRAYDDAVKVRTLLVETLDDAGRVFRRRGKRAKAEQSWQKAAVLDTKDVPSRYGLLYLYEKQRRDHDALEVCEDLCRIEPENPDHWLFVGLLYHRLNRPGPALEALQRAVQLDPGNPKYERAYQRIKQDE